MSGCHDNSCSITALIGALCDSSISGLSWKRRINSGGSRECAQRALRSRAYGALLAGLFQDSGSKQPPGPLANTPSHNKVLMMSFDLRTSGREQEAERLEELLGRLRDGGLPEMGSVLELLVQLAGSVAPPPASFARDYMRWERPVLRRAPLAGYLSRDTQRLEERAWSLICREEWGLFGGLCRGLSIMEAAPGSGLQGLGRRVDAEERFEKETRLTLFGALQHSKTTDMDVRLELPPVPSNADLTGLSIRVPVCVDHSDDEGFQSASNLTPDCSPAEPDVWEALRTFVPGRRRCWENIGCPPGQKEAPFLTEAGRDAFDQLYRLWEGEVRGLASTQTPSPLLPLPLDCQAQLVKDVLNVLIAVASATFPLNQGSLEFDVRADVCVSGTSPESVSRLLGELARYGTHYLRLSRFSLSGSAQQGLVFQAFTGGLRRYLHYYRACVLSTPASLSLLTIACHFRKLGRQLRYLSELCCVDGVAGAGRNSFPTGVKLLSCLYNEAQSNCSNENHPVLLSLLKSSCEPYTRFVSDWVYSGVFRDVYREFMIEVKEDYLSSRDRSFWTQGYTLISRDVEDCVPVFLRHIANDIYVCGKTINLLKICCPQHYIFRTDVSVPRIAVTFSLQEVQEIERDCAVYRRRMEAIAKHSATSREEQAVRTEQARQELINQVRESTAKTLERIRGQQVSARLQVAAQKRARFQELKQQLESGKDQAEEFSFTRELRDREQRLQALEEQLERRARLDLQAQYSRLSEAAARRELRAVWKLQRMKLDQRRHHFLRQDNQDMQALLETLPMAQRVNRSGSSVVINPAGDPIHSVPDTNRGTDSDCADVREHFSEVLESVPASSLLLSLDGHASLDHSSASVQKSLETQPMGGESTPDVQGPQDTEEACVSHADPSETERVCDADPSLSSALCGHASNAHVRTGEHVSEVATPAVVPNIHGHASDAHIRIGEHVSEVDTPTITPNIHGHASDAHIRIGEHVSEVDTPTITPNIHGHASDAHIRIGEHVSEVATPTITPNIHGHASDAHIRIGEHVSEVATPTITPNIHGHASDAHIRIGEHVSDVDTPTLTPSIHGHASDAHIRIGELVSDVDTPAFTPNIHGHASDAHIRIGEHVSDVTTPTITPNVHGHASDAHMKVGGLMSEVASSRPRCSKYGHASDSTLTAGCVVPAAPSLCALPGDTFRHSSDSTLTVACVDPRPAPLPGSAYGHSSQSSLGVGCVVGGMVLGSSRTSENPEKPADTQAPPAEETLYLSSLCSQYRAEQYQDSYGLSAETPDAELLLQVTRGPDGLPLRPLMSRTPDAGAVQLGEMMPLPVLMKHSVTAPLSTHVSMVNKAAVDYVFVELAVEKHFETLRHFLLMEDGEFALALSNQLFEKLGSGQTPGELLTPLVLNSILNKALQYSVHADSSLAARFTFSLRFLPEIFHPHAPDSLNCLELRYKVDWPLNIVITESCLKKYNRLFSFLLQLKHMVWSLRDVWFHLKRTAAVRGGGRCVQFHQLQLYRHEMQHFVKVIQGYIANQILQVSWSEFIQKLSAASDLDAIHRTHAEYINRAIFRALLTEKAAPVMNIIHSIFSLILKFRGQLIAQSWEVQQGEPVHPGFVAMQQSYNTFQYYSRFLFKVVTKLVDKGYQPHLEDFLLRINLNNYYKDS